LEGLSKRNETETTRSETGKIWGICSAFVPPQGQPLRQTFREWADATGLSEPFAAIQRQVNSNLALVAQYQSFANTPGALAPDHNARILEAARTLYAATSMMLKAFEVDPEGYVFPDRYLGNLDNYARPVFRFEFDAHFLSASKLSPKVQKNWIVVFRQRRYSRPPIHANWCAEVGHARQRGRQAHIGDRTIHRRAYY
jgi:hypothetical protein